MLAESTNQFLEAQLEDARRRLADTEKKLEDYRKAHAGEMPKDQDANSWGHKLRDAAPGVCGVAQPRRDRRLDLDRMLADLATPEAPMSPAPRAQPA